MKINDRITALMNSDLVQSRNQFSVGEAARILSLNAADTAGILRNLLRDGRLIKIETQKRGAKNQIMNTYVLNNQSQTWLRKKW